MRTYLFYDLETTDLNPCFGQVLQFAAIRTDLDLNEMTRHEIRVRLNADVIPSPAALIINRIDVTQLLQGENEYHAIQQIHELLNTPGTISVGYNSLGFDDEFLRFSFFKNLLPPYTHQYAKNCGRMDIYPMVLFYFIFQPDVLKWPILNDKISYKLEYLNQENQLTTGSAHNAMVDVQATLELAKRLKRNEAIWNYCTGLFDKSIDQQRLNQCETTITIGSCTYKIGFMIQLRGQENILTPVLLLGTSYTYTNQYLWLKLNQPALLTCTTENIAKTTQIVRKKLGESPFFISLSGRVIDKLTLEQKNQLMQSQQWVIENPTIVAEICKFYQQYQYPTIECCDVNAALYQIDFPSDSDKELMVEFHKAIPTNKVKIARQFSQPIYGELALRVLARFFTDRLSSGDKEKWQLYLQNIYSANNHNLPVDYRNNQQRSISKTLIEIAQLITSNTLDEQQHSILNGLKTYLEQLQNHAENRQGFFFNRQTIDEQLEINEKQEMLPLM